MCSIFKHSFFMSFSFIAILLFMNDTAFANDDQVENTENKQVEEYNDLEKDTVGTLLCEVVPLGYPSDVIAFQRIHNDAYYHLFSFSGTGDVIQLHDASKWFVRSNQRHIVLQWVKNDDLFIKPQYWGLSNYRYVIHNRTTDQVVEVNLKTPPLPMGIATFCIVNIEPYARLVQLSDNTIWRISPYDTNFSYWQIGQRVVVGVNNHWRTTEFPHALINVDIYKEPYSQSEFYGYPVGY